MNQLLELKHGWQPQSHFGKYDDLTLTMILYAAWKLQWNNGCNGNILIIAINNEFSPIFRSPFRFSICSFRICRISFLSRSLFFSMIRQSDSKYFRKKNNNNFQLIYQTNWTYFGNPVLIFIFSSSPSPSSSNGIYHS